MFEAEGTDIPLSVREILKDWQVLEVADALVKINDVLQNTRGGAEALAADIVKITDILDGVPGRAR